MRHTSASDWLHDGEDEDEDEPQFELYEFEEDAWSLAAKAAANDPKPQPGAAAVQVEAPLELFDARRSLELSRDPWKVEAFFQANRDLYPRLADVRRRIDWHAAQLLEDWLVEEQERMREEALEQIRTAPRHSGRRLDGEIVRQIVIFKATALSLRQRQVYHFCFERGFSVNQCAMALGIGGETVRTHLRRLRKHRPAAWDPPKSA